MARTSRRGAGALAAAICLLAGMPSAQAAFTVKDDIGLTQFGDGSDNPIRLSPNGKIFAVWSERGRLQADDVEDSLHFFSTDALSASLSNKAEVRADSIQRVALRGPVINDWRWLADSTGVAFLQNDLNRCARLYLYDLASRRVMALTPDGSCVGSYGIRDGRNFTYSVEMRPGTLNSAWATPGPVVPGAGRSFFELSFPAYDRRYDRPLTTLWMVVDGKRREIMDRGRPVTRRNETASNNPQLVLAPDGKSVVTAIEIPAAPRGWAKRYLPPFDGAAYRVQDGKPVFTFVRFDLAKGTMDALLDAPTAEAAGWWLIGNDTSIPSWSADGHAVLVPGTFVPSADNGPSTPCIAMVTIAPRNAACVEHFVRPNNEVRAGAHPKLMEARFAHGAADAVDIDYRMPDGTVVTRHFKQMHDGSWAKSGESPARNAQSGPQLSIRQDFNTPPMLVAAKANISRVIWNPNPQLNTANLTPARAYNWKDTHGNLWTGGLFLPSTGKAPYPLVVQTHGFDPGVFNPSGIYTTAFAARELQSAGIAVLQVSEKCATGERGEDDCAIGGYRAAIGQLAAEKLIDPAKVGMTGFSRTCFYVMTTLTRSGIPVAAASITDGLMLDYTQYIFTQGHFDDGVGADAVSVFGAVPFGKGLDTWRARSPGFNLDKVRTPLQVVATNTIGVMEMWEPYAGLMYLHRPTEFTLLKADEHVLTTPSVRLASQGGTVDWFRFWLKGEEDSDPVKREQYARWEHLCDLQIAEKTGRAVSCLAQRPQGPANRVRHANGTQQQLTH